MMKSEQLHAGVCVTDITPALEVGLLISSIKGLYEPFKSVRLPLKARVLVLGPKNNSVVIVALDLLSLSDTSVGGWQTFKQAVCGDIPAERVILCCTHTHSAPESGGLSDLYLTSAYTKWLEDVKSRIRTAIVQAHESMRPCRLAMATGTLENFSLQRRIPTEKGIVMSDALQPIPDDLMKRGSVDRRVRVFSFQDLKGSPIATVVHALCHPVHEMCIPAVSSEFPGEMCIELERLGKNGVPLFLNGASGDINPPTVSLGPEYARRYGLALASVVQETVAEKKFTDHVQFGFLHAEITLNVRSGSGVKQRLDALARVSALRVGSCAFVFLPGEPFVETALEIEKASPFKYTVVTGFSENNIGYVPTQKAFEEGGYETGPGKWSYLEKNADRIMVAETLRLLEKLYNKEVGNYHLYESKIDR